MIQPMLRKIFLAAAALPLVFALAAIDASAADGDKPEAKKGTAKKVEAKKKKKRAKARGRLPNFYGKVVTPEQRKKIYAIQAKYKSEIQKSREQLLAIQKLRKQIRDIVKQRNEEVKALLSEEQLKEVEAIVAENKAKRAKQKPARKAEK